MSLFIFLPSQASADPYLSALVKQQASNYCGFSASVLPLEESEKSPNEIQSNQEASGSDSNSKTAEVAATSSSTFGSKSDYSLSGSRIILSDGVEDNYGYCHVFKRHMARANNYTGYDINGVHQFQYAEYPDATLDIAMEVINEQSYLGYSGNYRYKQGYSNLAGQTVRIILAKGNSTFANYRFLHYDWVIVTMYPQ